MTSWTTARARAGLAAAALAACLSMPQMALSQPRPPAGMQETMDIGDEPGRVSTEEVSITEGPYARQMVLFRSSEAPGTVIIQSSERFLYIVQGNGRALRYGIGVGREGFQWSGLVQVSRKAEWPDWRPPPEMLQRQPYLPRRSSASTAPTSPKRSARRSRQAASGWPMATSPIFTSGCRSGPR